MKLRSRSLFTLLPLVALSFAHCGNPFGSTLSMREHGFRAAVYVRAGESERNYEFAVRGTSRRFQGLQGPFSILIVDDKAKKFMELDPEAKTYREAKVDVVPKDLDDHPLVPGFSEKAEAARRGLTQYSRENDTIFGANACNLWRFDDRPDDPNSPSTTYWVSPALDRLVVRVDRETVQPDGNRLRRTTELRNVRRGADLDLFEVPKSYKKAG